jgi:hypothetical protein
VNGLDYRCYEGSDWTELPDFNRLKPLKTGPVDNFDLGVRTRDEGVGLQFSGLFDVPRNGIYKFYLISDDGSRLSVGEPNVRVEVIGQSQLPAPRQMFIGQLLDEAEDGSWSQIVGKVTQVWPAEEGLRMELSVGLARMEVEVTDKVERPESVLMNSLVRVTGFCQAACNSRRHCGPAPAATCSSAARRKNLWRPSAKRGWVASPCREKSRARSSPPSSNRSPRRQK